MVELNSDANGVLMPAPTGLVDTIPDRCDRGFSKARANCVLKAASMLEVQACK